jgi:hypothetical protein
MSFEARQSISFGSGTRGRIGGVSREPIGPWTRWRILVGEDAQVLDGMVRADPDSAYEPTFFTAMAEKANWRVGG